MKAVGVAMLVLALVVAVVPQFTDCASQGRNLKLANGNLVPMKCHWTAMAEIAMGAALGLLGILMLRAKSDETKRNLSAVGIGLGALVALIPATLIGVCANPDMVCKSIMQPTLMLSGLVTMGICLIALVNTLRAGSAPMATA